MITELLYIKAFIKNTVSGTRPSGLILGWFYLLVVLACASVYPVQSTGSVTYYLPVTLQCLNPVEITPRPRLPLIQMTWDIHLSPNP